MLRRYLLYLAFVLRIEFLLAARLLHLLLQDVDFLIKLTLGLHLLFPGVQLIQNVGVGHRLRKGKVN